MLGHVDSVRDIGLDEVIYITGWLGEQIKPLRRGQLSAVRRQLVVQGRAGRSEPCHLAGARTHQRSLFYRFRRYHPRIDLQAMAASDADGVHRLYGKLTIRAASGSLYRPMATVERCVEKTSDG